MKLAAAELNAAVENVYHTAANENTRDADFGSGKKSCLFLGKGIARAMGDPIHSERDAR